MAIESLRALMEAGENQDLCDIIIHSDCVDRGVTKEASFEKMRALYAAIRRARAGYDPALRSASGMVGGDGAKMRAYVQSGKTICGDYIGQVIAQALEMGEKFMRMIKGEASDEEIESLEEASALKDISHMPARVKCAVLGWRTLKEALDEEQK